MRRTFAWSVFSFFSTILFCYTVLILSSPHGCSAIDTITINSSLVDGQTLVSAGNRFELGFFGPSNTSNVKRFIGIWYTANPEIVVWVANRTNPLSDRTGVLSIANDNLMLLDEKRKLYWSTNSTQLGLKRKNIPEPVAKLNDDGNFFLFDDDDWTGKIFWQSFDYSTDTYLFGMKMGKNFALTSWTSEKDPAPGKFTFKQDQGGGDQFVVMEKSIPYWRSYRPELSGQIFRSDENKMPGTLINFFNITKKGTENLYDQRLVMNFTGELQYWQLDADTKTWSLIWRVPKDNCSVFNYCGNFGICNAKNRLTCKCMPGFKPRLSANWNAGIFSDGCIRNSTSSCGSMFLNLTMRKVENTDALYQPENETDCRQECLNNCQCQAYSYFVQRDTKSCFTWTEELRDLQEDQDGGGYKLYVRVAVSDIEITTRNCETCGTNLVPYPLSTGSKCGDPLYSTFDCNNYTNQLKFIPSSGSYKVISVYPEKRIFVIQIQSKEAKNCDSLQLSRTGIMQLNRSSPFSVTRCENYQANLVSNDYSQNIGVEVEISWEPPLPPTCNSSADCKDWPYSTCNATENGQRRCLCNSNFQWNGSALNCTPALPSGGAQSTGEASNGNKSLPLILGVSLAIAMGLLCMVVSIYMWKRKVVKKQTKQRKATFQRYDTERGVKELIESGPFKEKDGTGIDVPFFDFESILAATDNFSEENKLGKGGFGPVYKGKFPGGDEIAVKRLSSVSGQGLEEFKNEVVLIAKLQHRNLVRLLGYCISGEEKILLYEYMPNRSMDSWIFDESISHRLDWETRFNIILGIARGMLYLHQDSRLRIIHRDLKTSNILLDAEMNPKISDFGLARMIQGKQTEANTLKVMGTYGYMAPEYALDGLFSIKSDVFSFGVVMIEIISGKKNMRFYQVEHAPSLIGYAWGLWQEGKAMDLMEEPLRWSCNASEFLRCVHVGLLCVQEDPGERPTMSNVVVLLGSETASLPVPNPPAFATRKTLSSTASTSSKLELDAEISTLQEGR